MHGTNIPTARIDIALSDTIHTKQQVCLYNYTVRKVGMTQIYIV